MRICAAACMPRLTCAHHVRRAEVHSATEFCCACTASWRTLGRIGGGLIGAAAGAVAAKRLQETRAQAASIVLYNLLASKADPRSLTRQEVTRSATQPIVAAVV